MSGRYCPKCNNVITMDPHTCRPEKRFNWDWFGLAFAVVFVFGGILLGAGR